jgi:hypothetical protein
MIGSDTLNNYLQNVQLIVITMTTVGYGNVGPLTMLGRVIAVITAFWGSFILSLFVVAVTQLFELT